MNPNDPWVVDQRMNSRLDAMRYAYLALRDATAGEDLSSLRKEAQLIEEGKLSQRDLIYRWRDQAVRDHVWVRGADHDKKLKKLDEANANLAAALDSKTQEAKEYKTKYEATEQILDTSEKSNKTLTEDNQALEKQNSDLTATVADYRAKLNECKQNKTADFSAGDLFILAIRKVLGIKE